MDLILSVKYGRFHLEKIDKAKNRRSTNDIQKIYNALDSISNNALRATYAGRNIKLYFGNRNYVVLKNYKRYENSELFQALIKCIDENTKIVNNVRHINETKFKRLVLTGALALSLASAGFSVANHVSLKDVGIQTEMPDLENPDDLMDIVTPKPTTRPTPTLPPVIEPTMDPTIIQTAPITKENEFEYKTFQERLEDSLLMRADEVSFSGIPLATRYSNYYINRVKNFIETEGWEYYQKYGEEFGLDPYLGLAIGYTETGLSHKSTIPGGSNYNGYGVGIGQLESPDGTDKVTAYNYKTKEYETVTITMENACDLECNIKITMMLLQNKLKKYNNNIYATIQSYNYGNGAMNKVLSAYAEEKGCSIEDILTDYTDIGWLKYVNDLHENPQKYLPGWKHKTYGNANYIKDVLGFYIGTESINTTSDGSKIAVDLITMETTDDVKVVDKIK